MSGIVSKFGGTSNATPEAFMTSLEQAAKGTLVVTSAPGKLSQQQIETFPADVAGGADERLLGNKVTDTLLEARAGLVDEGEIPEAHIQAVQARFAAVTSELGSSALPTGWIDNIPGRVRTAIQLGEDHASMIGEMLQAEVYQAGGFTYLDPGTAGRSLAGSESTDERESWRLWLQTAIQDGRRYILPGNISYDGTNLRTFSRGGSDISGALAAYGISADVYRNMTDTSAQSIDPRIITDSSRRRHLDYLTYAEGRELGRNGVGLLHPRAIVPLMGTGIPTEIHNTFDPGGEFTRMGDELDGGRDGLSIAAISLIPDVKVIKVHEPGRSEVVGWAAQHDGVISSRGINLIDTIGDGADSHIFIVEGSDGSKAEEAIGSLARKRSEISSEARAFVTLVGHGIGGRKYDILTALKQHTNVGERDQDGQVILADHSVRLAIERSRAVEFVDKAHRYFIEGER